MGSAAPGFYLIDQSEHYLPPMMLLASGQVVDPNRRCRRVAITPSMLFAYAHMRGPDQHYFDPLLHALYPTPNRYLDQERTVISSIENSDSLDELPRGAIYFWDPIACENRRPSQPLPTEPLPAKPPPAEPLSAELHPTEPRPIEPHDGIDEPRVERPQFTYDEFTRQHPPVIGKNHSKGDKVWDNFGYYLADGTWVDPESEGELYNAYQKSSGGPRAKHFPDIAKVRDAGPRIMPEREQHTFYREFAADVFDEVDGEGDPRAWRITPEIFAQWASGASAGERYQEAAIATPEKRRSSLQTFPERCRFPPKPKPEMQFDVDTGSILSGAYEAETNPSLLLSPLGVDIVRPPPTFNYSYPGVMQDLELHGFGAAWADRQQRGDVVQSTVSTPESFTSERARRNLTHPEDVLEYEHIKQNIFNLRAEAQEVWQEIMVQLHKAQHSAEHRIELYREIYFLKKYIKNHPNTHDAPIRIPATLNDVPRAPTPPTPTLRRKQYQRYIIEAEASDTIHLSKARLLGARLKSDHESILNDIEPGERERLRLLKMLGIRNVHEFPRLMPRRKVYEDPLAHFKQWEKTE